MGAPLQDGQSLQEREENLSCGAEGRTVMQPDTQPSLLRDS